MSGPWKDQIIGHFENIATDARDQDGEYGWLEAQPF